MFCLKSVVFCTRISYKCPGSTFSHGYFSNIRSNSVKIRKFTTTPVREVRGRWPEARPKVESLEPQIDGLVVEAGNLELSRLWKPLAFSLGFSAASIIGAAIWQYENIHRRTKVQDWFLEKKRKAGKWRNEVNRWWNNLTVGQRVFAPLCFLNIMVFLAWKVPMFQPAMVKYFCSNPAAKNICWPMLLSSFSHYSALHIFANMYVLHSFATGCVSNMGKEQFLAFYLSAGVIASFASYLHKFLINRPGLSLGASGAILGVLGYSCTRFPDLELNIIFLPFITFKAAAAIKVIMGLDALGVLMGWRFFDHAAHLGGALFGVFWSAYGSTYIWNNRQPIVQMWYNLRNLGPGKD